MRWILAFHLIFVVCWFAGLFYLPRLYVYHAQATDSISIERFKMMERRLYYGIMTPSAILTLFLGFWLLSYNFSGYIHTLWMDSKLCLVTLLVIYHWYCGRLLKLFRIDKNPYSQRFYRWFNELPAALLLVIVILVIVQP